MFVFGQIYPIETRAQAPNRSDRDWIYVPLLGGWRRARGWPRRCEATHWIPAPPSPAEWAAETQAALERLEAEVAAEDAAEPNAVIASGQLPGLIWAELSRLAGLHDMPPAVLLSRALSLLSADLEGHEGRSDA